MASLVLPPPDLSRDPYNATSVDKIVVTASYANFDLSVTHDSSVDLQQFPLSKIRSFDWSWPVLVTDAGPLWDTNAIVRFVARSGSHAGLLGQSGFEEGLVNSWIEFSSTALQLAVGSWVYPVKGYLQLSPHDTEIAKSSVLRLVKIVEDHLLDHTFLANDRFTLADIVLSLTIRDLYVHVFDEALCKTFHNTTRWLLTCLNQPTFTSALQQHPHYLAQSHIDQLLAAAKAAPQDKEVSLQHTSNEEAEAGEGAEASGSDVGEVEERGLATDSDGGGLAGTGGGTTEGSDSEKRLVKKEKKKKTRRDVVATSATRAIQLVSQKELLPRKLTEQDLFGKAIPSAYHSPQPTKTKSHKHPGQPTVSQSLHQPK